MHKECVFKDINIMQCSKTQYCAYCNLLSTVEDVAQAVSQVQSMLIDSFAQGTTLKKDEDEEMV